MGRGKLSMKLVEKEKARATTMKKRIEGLKKKAHEFSVLCDVKVCMIIFEPKLKDNPARVEVWPSDPVEVRTIIDKYKSKAAMLSQKKFFSLFDFINLRKRQVHDEVAQVRRANFRAKFPTWDNCIDNFSHEQIASFLTKLDLNLEVAKKKITLMKGDDQIQEDNLLQSSNPRTLVLGDFNAQSQSNPCANCILAAFRPKDCHSDNQNQFQDHVPLEIQNHYDQIQAFPQRNLQYEVTTREQRPIPEKALNIQIPPLSPADEALVKLSLSLNPISNSMNPIDKSLRMSMMNNLDFIVQSGIASSSRGSSAPNNHNPSIGMPNNNVMINPPSDPVVYDARSTAMLNNVMFNEPKAAFQTRFYAPPMQLQPEATRNLFPQMHPSYQLTDFYHDTNEYEMKNKKQRF